MKIKRNVNIISNIANLLN